MKLAEGFVGHKYVIDKMRMNEKEKNRFYRMQMKEGKNLTIISKRKGYPFLIEMEGNRIAFSKKAADCIEVIPYV